MKILSVWTFDFFWSIEDLLTFLTTSYNKNIKYYQYESSFECSDNGPFFRALKIEHNYYWYYMILLLSNYSRSITISRNLREISNIINIIDIIDPLERRKKWKWIVRSRTNLAIGSSRKAGYHFRNLFFFFTPIIITTVCKICTQEGAKKWLVPDQFIQPRKTLSKKRRRRDSEDVETITVCFPLFLPGWLARYRCSPFAFHASRSPFRASRLSCHVLVERESGRKKTRSVSPLEETKD